MSATYGKIPAGSIVSIPPSIPSGLLYRVKSLNGISKQTLKMVPLSGQTQVSSGGKIIVALPATSLVDLSTFELNFKGYTQHGANGATWETTAGTSTNISNFVNKRYFPRNIASLIENLEITIKGQSRQNINQYGSIYNVLSDYMSGHDATGKNRCGQNDHKTATHPIKLLIITDNYKDTLGSLLVVQHKVLIIHF
jgi:hypothetical protein